MSSFKETSIKISIDGDVNLLQDIHSYTDLREKIFEKFELRDDQYHLVDPMSVTPISKSDQGLQNTIQNSLMLPAKLILQKVKSWG